MFGFGKHIGEHLSAYCHGQLPPEEARRVAAHLEGCAGCRREYQEIRRGAELAAHLSVVAAPETVWRGIEARLDEAERPAVPVRAMGLRPASAFALLLLLAAGGALWYYGFRERLRIEAAAAAPSAFEVAARDAHRRRLAGDWQYDFSTSLPQQLRPWVREHAGFGVSLADVPEADAARIELLGAKMIQAGRARAVAIGYTIDGRPVTLVTARAADLDEALPDRWYRKDVSYRVDSASGYKLLTWAAGGQAYVLISDLPGLGTQSCIICHTARERRELIQTARPRT
jgi:anti-sigma factor RsiW